MADRNDDYIQVGVPDKELLADLLIQARGTERTMAEFAHACGVSPSTFSRIMKGNITKPLSVDLLYQMHKNSSDPRNYTFERFLEANGLEDRASFTEKQLKRKASRKLLEQRVNDAITVVNAYFLKMQWKIQRINQDGFKGDTHPLFPPEPGQYDIAYRVEMENGKTVNWGFCVIPLILSEEDRDSRSMERYVRSIVTKYQPTFLQDAWLPTTMYVDRVTFIFLDRDLKECFVNEMRQIPIRRVMTALVFPADQKLQDNYLPQRYAAYDEEVLGQDAEQHWYTDFSHTTGKWDHLENRPDFSDIDDESADSQDVFERLISREMEDENHE